jgi:signal transduction histidine kinase
MIPPAETPPNILIVDDTPANLDLLTEILRNQGYRVRPALSGELALSAAQAAPPDLILLDINMPGMDGFDVCAALKAKPPTAAIPIIFISVMDMPDAIVRGFELGGVDYVTKPFRPREVLARVQHQLTLIQQQQQLDAYYQQELQRWEEIDQMKQQFIYSATHDLKNPLNIIWGYVAMLDGMKADEFEQVGSEFVEGIRWGAEKMQRLITDILNLAQIQTGVNLHIQRVNVADFLTGCLSGFDVLARQKGLTLTHVPLQEDGDVFFDIDTDRMGQVMDNLVVNAIKYTPAGGAVTVSADVTDAQVILHVRDSGLGIPPDAIPHLFEAFYRVSSEAHREIDGTGLGLSIVKTVVSQHSGQIDVTSTLGKGSAFSVTLARTR